MILNLELLHCSFIESLSGGYFLCLFTEGLCKLACNRYSVYRQFWVIASGSLQGQPVIVYLCNKMNIYSLLFSVGGMLSCWSVSETLVDTPHPCIDLSGSLPSPVWLLYTNTATLGWGWMDKLATLVCGVHHDNW